MSKRSKANVHSSRRPKVRRNQRAKRVKVQLSLLALTVSTIGLVWQLTEVSLIYYQHQTTTEITFKKSTEIVPPALTLCFPLTDVLAKRRLPPGLKKFAQGSPIDAQYASWLARTPANRLSQYTLGFGDILTSLLGRVRGSYDMYNPGQHQRHFNRSISISGNMFYRNDQKCYTLYQTDKIANRTVRLVLEYEEIVHGYQPGAIVRYVFNRTSLENISRAEFYLHDIKQQPQLYEDFPLRLAFDRHEPLMESLSITFSRTVSEKLSHPYSVNCKLNDDLENVKRQALLDRCVIAKSLEQFNGVPAYVVTDSRSNVTMLSMFKIESNETLYDMLQEVVVECHRQVPRPDCRQVRLMPSILEATNTGGQLHLLFVNVFLPISPDTIIKMKARMDFVEYVTYVLSCLSFWYGVSVLKFDDDLTGSVRRVKHLFASSSTPIS